MRKVPTILILYRSQELNFPATPSSEWASMLTWRVKYKPCRWTMWTWSRGWTCRRARGWYSTKKCTHAINCQRFWPLIVMVLTICPPRRTRRRGSAALLREYWVSMSRTFQVKWEAYRIFRRKLKTGNLKSMKRISRWIAKMVRTRRAVTMTMTQATLL